MSIVPLMLALIVIAVVASIVIAGARSGKRDQPSGEAVCGQCGYNVRGLPSFTCPECGSDLREVGIVSPERNKNHSLAPLWWQIPMLLIGCLSLSMLIGALSKNETNWTGWATLPIMILVFTVGLAFLIRWNLRSPSNGNRTLSSSNMERPSVSRRASEPSDSPAPLPERTSAVLTIMFIDMQDYTAQTSTHSRLKLAELVQLLRDLVTPYTKRRNGRIIKSLGDGLLLTFASPTEALLGGREIQQDAIASALPPLRIGVSTGEVSMFTDDVLGEPVNLASRIEKLAEPGQVYFSEATFHAMTRSEVPHESAGTFEIKGLDGQRTVYRVTT